MTTHWNHASDLVPRTMIRTALHLDIGLRDQLEDTAGAVRLLVPGAEPADVLLVLDGVGGEVAGEMASTLGAKFLAARLVELLGESLPGAQGKDAVGEILRSVLQESLVGANEYILLHIAEDPQLAGMATTIVCAIVYRAIVVVAWLGDSRCYHFHKSHIRRLTRDHKPAVDSLDCRVSSLDPGSPGPVSHTITRYLGQSEGFRPEFRISHVSAGDILLLCTDGLTDVLDNEDLAEEIAAHQAGLFVFDELPRHLVHEALNRGTTDNVSVLCAECVAISDGAAQPMFRTHVSGYRAALANRFQTCLMENLK